MAADDEVILDLLERWEDARAAGTAPSVEELCRDRPDLIVTVRAKLAALNASDWMRPDMPPATGTRVLAGRYRLERLVGQGGYGQVWRAYDEELHRPVAVKVPNATRRLAERQIDQLLAEARRVARLRHPDVVAVHDVLKEGAAYVIVADFIAGEDLDARLRRGPLPVAEAVGVAVRVARVLAFAHGQGVVHRDIKPSNVLLSPDGGVHVCDFGIAATTQELVTGGDRRATLPYAGPERLGDGPVDHRTDLWSLGVVLFEMLTGRRPFDADDPARLQHQIRTAEPPAMPGVPARLAAVCRRCLAKRPDERFASGADVADALDRSLRRRVHTGVWFGLGGLAAGVIALAGSGGRTGEPKPGVGTEPVPVVPPPAAQVVEPKLDAGSEPVKEDAPPRPPVRVLDGHVGPIRAVRFRPDGGWIASADEKTLRLWPPAGEPVTVDLPSPPTSLVFGPAGLIAYTGHEDGVVRQWWVGARTPTERAAVELSWAVAPDRSRLALLPFVPTQHAPFVIRSWPGDGTPVQALAVSPSGKWAAWTTQKKVYAWDIAGNRPVAPRSKPERATVALCFVPDAHFKPDEMLLAGYHNGPERRADLSVWKPVPFADGLGLSPRGTMQNFGTMPGVQDVAADPDFTFIVATLEGGLAAFAKAADGPGFHLVAQLGHTMPGTRRTPILPDAARALSYGEEGRLCLWEPKTHAQTVVSDPHPAAITDVAVSPDGGVAATGCVDGKLRFWRLPPR